MINYKFSQIQTTLAAVTLIKLIIHHMNNDNKHVGHFISSVVFFQLLPLIPLWFEYMHTKDITMDSYILCASMYAFATGFSSKYEWMLGVCFLIGLLIAGSYKGQIINSKSALPFLDSTITYCLLGIFLMHFFERWERHINGKEPFFLFNLTTSSK